MPPTFFFVMVGMLQFCLFLIGVAAAFLIGFLPSARSRLAKMLRLVLGGALGGLAGALGWYLLMLATLLTFASIETLVPPSLAGLGGYFAVGTLPLGYILGTLLGGRIGWRWGAQSEGKA